VEKPEPDQRARVAEPTQLSSRDDHGASQRTQFPFRRKSAQPEGTTSPQTRPPGLKIGDIQHPGLGESLSVPTVAGHIPKTVSPRPPAITQQPLEQLRPAFNLTPWVMTQQKLEESLPVVAQRYNVPAVALGMASDRGDFSFVKGVRKHGVSTPVGQNDRFMLATMSAFMTRIVLARLIDQGILSWTSTITDQLPQYREYINPGHEDTTIEMAAAESLGITTHIDTAEDGALTSYISGGAISGPEGRHAVILSYLSKPPNQKPGSAAFWSHTSSMILAAIMELATGTTIEQLMERELFVPLGMLQSGCDQHDWQRNSTSPEPVQPWPHVYDKHSLKPSPINPADNSQRKPALIPAVGIGATASDLTRMCRFCLDGKDSSGAPLLSAESWGKLFSPFGDSTTTRYGLEVVDDHL